MLDKFKIDAVVGAIPVHLLAGIWGTLVVPWSNPDTSIVTQFIGVISIGIFVSAISAVVWFVMKSTIGIRVSEEAELNGVDKAELGMDAYPDFTKS